MEYELIKSKGIKKNKNDSFFKMLGGRSVCDSCGKQLYWYENIPVISWLLQKGKSKCCQKKLSVLYPIVEIMTGILFVIYSFLGRQQESPLQFGLGLLIIVFLMFSAVFDLKYMILPDFSTVILIITTVIILFVNSSDLVSLQYNMFSAVGAFGFLGLLYLITKGKGMGLGDVKLAVFMGLFLGGLKTVLAFYVAFVVGALVSLVLMFFKKANKKTLVPFGPFLIFGTITSWFFGNEIIKFLVSHF